MNTVEALEQSISKWEGIVQSTEAEDNGGENCALCDKFYRPAQADCSSKCPVAKKTKRSGCKGSPYVDWLMHTRDDHGSWGYPKSRVYGCRGCLRIAREELTFLESLRGSK